MSATRKVTVIATRHYYKQTKSRRRSCFNAQMVKCFNLALLPIRTTKTNVARQPFLLQTAVMCWAVYQH
jgi:hypothetical protein